MAFIGPTCCFYQTKYDYTTTKLSDVCDGVQEFLGYGGTGRRAIFLGPLKDGPKANRRNPLKSMEHMYRDGIIVGKSKSPQLSFSENHL